MEEKCVRLYGPNFQLAHICLKHMKHCICACVMVLQCTVKHLCPYMAACEYFACGNTTVHCCEVSQPE